MSILFGGTRTSDGTASQFLILLRVYSVVEGSRFLDLNRIESKVKKPRMPKVTIIIPAKNEEKNLEAAVEKTIKSMVDSEIDFEVLVVDDGSSDNTFEIAKNLAVKDSRVVVITNHSNHGKGFSIRKALEKADGDLVVTLDADGQHEPEEIPRLIWPILNGEADLVQGSRFLEKSNYVPYRHVLGNKVVSLCFNLLFGSSFTDVLLGFRAFRKNTLKEAKLKSNGYLVDIEVLGTALKRNAKIAQVQTICHYPRKSSVLRGISMVGQILAGLFYLRFTRK